jgi:hypothetical protein
MEARDSERERSSDIDQAARVGGIVLVGLGVLFLVQQVFGLDVGKYGWPLFIILPGLAILAGFVLGGRGSAGLAVPGCVVTTVGLMLAVQNTLAVWQTWSYAWALIPAAVGLGLRLQGERLEQTKLIQRGTRLLEGGLLAFVVFAVFFELILDISHLGANAARSILGPAVLILAGLYLLLRREARSTS